MPLVGFALLTNLVVKLSCVVVAIARTSFKTDPAYLRLLPIRDKLQKSLRDAERDVSEYSAKVTVNSNIVVMVSCSLCWVICHVGGQETYTLFSCDCVRQKRVKQLLETAQTQRDEIAAELEKVRSCAPCVLSCIDLIAGAKSTDAINLCLPPPQIKTEIFNFENN